MSDTTVHPLIRFETPARERHDAPTAPTAATLSARDCAAGINGCLADLVGTRVSLDSRGAAVLVLDDAGHVTALLDADDLAEVDRLVGVVLVKLGQSGRDEDNEIHGHELQRVATDNDAARGVNGRSL